MSAGEYDDSDVGSIYADDGLEQNLAAFSNAPLSTGTRDLNISTHYVKNWTLKHAFRELFQNQRDPHSHVRQTEWLMNSRIDGILESFNLELRALKPEYVKDTIARRIEISFLHPKTGELCGWIIFAYDEKNEGTLEMVNCKARLYDENFDLGGTTKANKANQAGKHGEGFKVACVELCRNHFSIRAISVNSYINIGLNVRKKVVARVSHMQQKAIYQKQHIFKVKEADGKRKIKIPKPWEDVTFEVGAVRTRKALDGTTQRTSKIPLRQFEEWLTVTTIINPPSNIIRTARGDLILDEAFAGRVFLRGLELPRASASGKSFRFGYDFVHGSTGRDRTSLSNANDEAKLMAEIWSEAIEKVQGTDREKRILVAYTTMLSEDNHADVHRAKNTIGLAFVSRIWKHLLDKAWATTPPGFYYCPDFDDDAQVIQHYLKQSPVPLTRNMWELLQAHGLCRAAEEERHIRFRGLPAIEPETLGSFGAHLLNLLSACLLAHPGTVDKKLVVVDGGALNLLTYYNADTKTWKVEKKLFELTACHDGVYFCEAISHDTNSGNAKNIFWCNHAVTDLYQEMLRELKKEAVGMPTGADTSALRKRLVSMAHHMVSRAPQNVKITATGRVGQLCVKWESMATRVAMLHSSSTYLVTLHDCSNKTRLLLRNNENDKDMSCGCTESVRVSLSSKQHVFKGIEPGHSYFATVVCDDEVAIYAVSGDDCAPRATAEVIDLVNGYENEVEVEGPTRGSSGRSLSPILIEDRMLVDNSSNGFSDGNHSSDSSSDSDSDIDTIASSLLKVSSMSRSCRLPTNAIARSPNSLSMRSRSRIDHRTVLRTNSQSSIERVPTLQDVLATTDALASDNITIGEIARRDWHEGRATGILSGVLVGVPKAAVSASASRDANVNGRPARRLRLTPP